MKCIWVKSKWEKTEESTRVVKRSEGLSYRVSIIIRRYIEQMKLVAYMAVSSSHFFSYSFGSTLYHCVYIWLYVLYASV